LGLADFLPAVHQKIQAYSEHNAHLVAKLAEARDTLHAICACATVSTDEDHLAALDDLAMKLAIWLDPLQKNGKTLAEETQSALTAFLPAAYTALDAARSQAVINSETRVPLALAIAANPSLADTLPTKGGT
jgi:ubiquinone biosynthesis protein Coq4